MPSSLPKSIVEAGAWLRTGRISCVELTRGFLARIEAAQPALNAMIAVTAARALDEAAQRDRALADGNDLGPLHGIPIVHKDCFDVLGAPTSAGSRLYAARQPLGDADVVTRLAAAGAVTLGKTLMNELAAGTSGTNVHFGDVHNPWDLSRSPGGSSSGTGAALAARLALGGTGTDAGGSIRVPAACNGIVGLRPTLGSVPLGGCVPRSVTYDTAGPLARTAADCALLWRVMSGAPTSPRAAADGSAVVAARLDGLRLGMIEDFSLRAVDPAVRACIEAALARARADGAVIEFVTVPALADGPTLGELMDVMLWEFHRIMQPELDRLPDARKLLGPVVTANLARGAAVTETQYRSVLAKRARVAEDVAAALARIDALVTPVLPAPTPRLDDPVAAFDRGRELMLPVSFAGVPALAIPCGRDGGGMPVGMQFIGAAHAEEHLLAIGAAFEPLVGWPGWLPPIAQDQAGSPRRR